MNESLLRRSPGALRTWLQLLRAPNLFTVPGDPVAGYLISNAGFVDHTLPLVGLASLLFYGAGLLLNDLVDIAEDQEERPNRPLPSGNASPRSVRLVLWLLNGAGMALVAATGQFKAVLAAGATVLAVWAYNCLTKKRAGWGALNMGLCRSLSMMIGAFAGPAPNAAPIAAVVALSTGLFIAAVTNLARFETRQTPPKGARLLPLFALLPGLLFGIQNSAYSPDKIPAAGIFTLTAAACLLLCMRLWKNPNPLPPFIGAHIRLLLPLQAAACWFGASQGIGPACAVVLLALWPVSKLVSRWFYAS